MSFDWTFLSGWLALALIGIGLAAAAAALLSQRKQLRQARVEIAALEQRMGQLQEQYQRELLAMGQRVIEADKLVRRFGERLDAMENAPAGGATQYGQLEALLAGSALRDEGAVSAAEQQLLSLLRRASHPPSGNP
jgi:hypothetical protein